MYSSQYNTSQVNCNYTIEIFLKKHLVKVLLLAIIHLKVRFYSIQGLFSRHPLFQMHVCIMHACKCFGIILMFCQFTGAPCSFLLLSSSCGRRRCCFLDRSWNPSGLEHPASPSTGRHTRMPLQHTVIGNMKITFTKRQLRSTLNQSVGRIWSMGHKFENPGYI